METRKCTALIWRPDGKVLCVGFDNGDVALYDVKNCEPILKNTMSGPVTSVTWVSCESSVAHRQNKTNADSAADEAKQAWQFLNSYPSLSKAFSYNPSGPEESQTCNKLHDPEDGTSTLLICGSGSGQVQFWFNGFLPIGGIDVQKLIGCPQPLKISDVNIGLNKITHFTVVSVSKQTSELHLNVVSSPLLSSCFPELVALAEKQSILNGTIDYMSDTLQQISEAWESILAEMDSKLTSYSNQMNDPDGMTADFLELLVLGTTSPELEQFLLQDLAEKGLKKLGQSIEVSYSNIQRLVLKYLHTVSQAVNFHLSEMFGQVESSDKYAVIGISAEAVKRAQKAAGIFWAKAIELQQVIDESMKSFKAFFRWLYVEILASIFQLCLNIQL